MRNLHRRALAAALAAALPFVAVAATAGQCPTDKMGVDVTRPGAIQPKGVTDTVLGAIDLGKEPAMLHDRQLRLRRLVIQPGGVVPWHSHGHRPAIIYIVSGEVTEHASTCAVPIVHKAGEATPELHSTSHWWQNTGTTAAVLLSADILLDKSDKNM